MGGSMRRLAVLVFVLGMAVGIGIPAVGFHGAAVEGDWSAKDPVDGSRLAMTVTEIDNDAGIFEVSMTDSNATFGCVPAGPFEAEASGEWFNNAVDPPMLIASFDVPDDVQCLGGSQLHPSLPDALHFEWLVMDDGTLHESAGSIWAPVGRFIDDDFNIFEDDIEWMADQGITLGCNPEGTLYCPLDSVTRAQMASFLVRALVLPPVAGNRFNDVSGTHTANINALAEAGVTLGCNPAGTLFCPNDQVTREQMASFLARALVLPPVAGNRFMDVSGSHTANINAIAEAGITLGCNPAGTLYCPRDLVTRGQMAAFLQRALG